MATTTLQPEHERYARVESVRLGGVPVAVEWLPYGSGPQEIVATYGLLELEYAAFRRGAAIMDRTDRATLQVAGADRVDFLNRMVTQELKGLVAGGARQAFWLNRKGRIDADLLLCELPDSMLVDLDCHDAARAVETLSAFVFSEDVQIRDVSSEWARVSVHGPDAPAVLANAGAATDVIRNLSSDLTCTALDLGGRAAAARRDQCATPGIELWIAPESVARFFDSATSVRDDGGPHGKRHARPAGWYAYNIARIEAGTPLFHVDFGPENLPHETGVLQSRVSFKKGCYLGQEVVARMESLGKPKQRLVGLRTAQDLLPTAGSPVFERAPDGEPGNPVGTITSSAQSPMLGAVPVAFAMVKSAHAEAGRTIVVPAEGGRTEATIRAHLAFLDAQGRPA
jgi:folate-binding protein YgfZ